MTTRIVVIAGPTASGKSALALELAQKLNGEIINADSQQVYRGLDIGTGKPTREERGAVRHHLYDVCAPWEQLDAARFVSLADAAVSEVASRGGLPIVVGGTGLWLRALRKGLVDAPPRSPEIRARLEAQVASDGLDSLHARLAEVDPESAARIHPTDPVRIVRALEVFEQGGVPLSELHRRHALGTPRYDALTLAIEWPIEELRLRIKRRVAAMFADGLVDEARRALDEPRARDRVSRIMGYREALEVIEGRLSQAEAEVLVVKAQRDYAKRQRTWFRAEPEWRWLAAADASAAAMASVAAWGDAP